MSVVGVTYNDVMTTTTVLDLAQPTRAAAAVDALNDRLAKFELPKRVIFVDDLPRNTMGKVQKNLLRQEHEKLFAKQRTVHDSFTSC